MGVGGWGCEEGAQGWGVVEDGVDGGGCGGEAICVGCVVCVCGGCVYMCVCVLNEVTVYSSQQHMSSLVQCRCTMV